MDASQKLEKPFPTSSVIVQLRSLHSFVTKKRNAKEEKLRANAKNKEQGQGVRRAKETRDFFSPHPFLLRNVIR